MFAPMLLIVHTEMLTGALFVVGYGKGIGPCSAAIASDGSGSGTRGQQYITEGRAPERLGAGNRPRFIEVWHGWEMSSMRCAHVAWWYCRVPVRCCGPEPVLRTGFEKLQRR